MSVANQMQREKGGVSDSCGWTTTEAGRYDGGMDDQAPEPAVEPTSAATPPDEPTGERRPGWRQRIRDRMQPGLHRTWLNLRVWLPFLMNPFERKRLIRYTPKENRVGLDWKIDLPEQCWKCGEPTDLKKKKFSSDVRSYEYPVQIVIGAALTILMFLFANCLLSGWVTALLILLTLVLAGLLIRAKSWQEHVDLLIWSCPEHRKELVPPELVAYEDELHVHLPSAELTKAALAELADRRRGNRRPDYERPPRADGG